MIKRQIITFIIQVILSSLGMYICITLFGKVTDSSSAALFVVAGAIFAVINSVLKPIVKLLALPLAIITMGLSTLIINVAMIALTIHILPGVEMDIWGIIISSLILSFINSLANLLIPAYNRK